MWLLCLSSESFSESHETVVVKVSCFHPSKLGRKRMFDRVLVHRLVIIHEKKVFEQLLERYRDEFATLQKRVFCCWSSVRAIEIFDSLEIRGLSELEMALKREDKERITRNRLFLLEQTSSNLEILFIFLFFVMVYLWLR
ncbi:conserved hypothetical protein [Lausannevirus]|uniref:Uncharacterized protein n=1 Tax=Lausannevirus TaxID=999883 RepID=F2WKZ7_9VIRU|nr:hypothetical protein LAU_0065 [Lausannevirus]AEA06920.1 conserved hypothetical protein [Lausannevirus]